MRNLLPFFVCNFGPQEVSPPFLSWFPLFLIGYSVCCTLNQHTGLFLKCTMKMQILCQKKERERERGREIEKTRKNRRKDLNSIWLYVPLSLPSPGACTKLSALQMPRTLLSAPGLAPLPGTPQIFLEDTCLVTYSMFKMHPGGTDFGYLAISSLLTQLWYFTCQL